LFARGAPERVEYEQGRNYTSTTNPSQNRCEDDIARNGRHIASETRFRILSPAESDPEFAYSFTLAAKHTKLNKRA
jgi:hypothetical protein